MLREEYKKVNDSLKLDQEFKKRLSKRMGQCIKKEKEEEDQSVIVYKDSMYLKKKRLVPIISIIGSVSAIVAILILFQWIGGNSHVNNTVKQSSENREAVKIEELENEDEMNMLIQKIMEQDRGSDMPVLDYADESKVIFHDYNYLMLYDVTKEKIIRAYELKGPIAKTSNLSWEVKVNMEGTKAQVNNLLSSFLSSTLYDFEKDTVRIVEGFNNDFIQEYKGRISTKGADGGILAPDFRSEDTIQIRDGIWCNLVYQIPEWKSSASLGIVCYNEKQDEITIDSVFGEKGEQKMKTSGYKKGGFYNYYPSKYTDYMPK